MSTTAQNLKNFEAIATKYGVKIKRSRPYYPQSKGKVERLIRNINEEYFRLYENINDEALQEFILWYNTARIHDGIGVTPVERTSVLELNITSKERDS